MKTNSINLILDYLDTHYPDVKGELIYHNDIEILVAVVLSAQTTDKAVNLVTPTLFKRFPTVYDLANADIKEVESIIQSIGLYKNKAKNIVALSKIIVEKYDGHVPYLKEDLVSLPGVGNKTASVVRLELYKEDEFPVDTHVERIAKRLGLASKNDDVNKVEAKLKKAFPKNRWSHLHHQFIHFGRYFCTAKNPNCLSCGLKSVCVK